VEALFDLQGVSPSDSNEWYTPARYVDAAREVMGSIDLDPASGAEANQTVRAVRYYDQVMNGLAQPWHLDGKPSRAWLNPPYGRVQTRGRKTNQGIWIQRLADEYQAGSVEQAILLTTCRTDASWFGRLWKHAICFADHKVGFYVPGKGIYQQYSHTHGTLFVYFGPNLQRFVDVFKKFGPVVTPDGVHRLVVPTVEQPLLEMDTVAILQTLPDCHNQPAKGRKQ